MGENCLRIDALGRLNKTYNFNIYNYAVFVTALQLINMSHRSYKSTYRYYK